MQEITIDASRLQADVEAADQEVENLAAQLRALGRSLEAATRRAEKLKELRTLISGYAVGGEPLPEATSNEFAGIPATRAVQMLFKALPDGEMLKLDTVFEELKRRGFEGELNAVQVATSRLTKRGFLFRPQPSHYQLATDNPWELEDVDEATVAHFSQEPDE